jgi:hypothetical protein
MVGTRGVKGCWTMTAADFLPEIIETLDQGIQNIEFGKLSISFTIHEGRIVSIEKSFVHNIKSKVNEKVVKNVGINHR